MGVMVPGVARWGPCGLLCPFHNVPVCIFRSPWAERSQRALEEAGSLGHML